MLAAWPLPRRHKQFRHFLAQQGLPDGFAAAEIAHMVLGDRAGPARKLALFRIEFRLLLPQRQTSLLKQVLHILAPRHEGEQKPINPALVGKRATKRLSGGSVVMSITEWSHQRKSGLTKLAKFANFSK